MTIVPKITKKLIFETTVEVSLHCRQNVLVRGRIRSLTFEYRPLEESEEDEEVEEEEVEVDGEEEEGGRWDLRE